MKKKSDTAASEELLEQETAVEKTTEEQKPADRPVTRRYSKRGNRRGRYAYAAPLGMCISLLALVGVVALVFAGIGIVDKLTDTSELEHELFHYLEPVMAYTPTPFEDINTAPEQDVFLHAATYRISQQEQVRMLVEKDENTNYAVDDVGRIVVPQAEVEASYAALFGPDAPLTHRSLGEDTVVYSAADACYYVPFDSLNTGYQPALVSFSRNRSEYEVQIAYVSINDIGMDLHGELLEPDPAKATFFQTYVLERTDTGYFIKSCRSEEAE
ncbi:MAG: hypothetical protein E7541_07190 [Ruminococcaceae bacterium]|nr:hypothetical protein [Oscillospiraceae bacterium]